MPTYNARLLREIMISIAELEAGASSLSESQKQVLRRRIKRAKARKGVIDIRHKMLGNKAGPMTIEDRTEYQMRRSLEAIKGMLKRTTG